ncbi:MAG: hypothetical protein PHE17_01585 [Thiothrix sp.]|uniref:hypothetical protein n=1 Tax=Thiothrix sp. TaxID=1032 RepID=UPI00260752E2|nr:hypothetical protein [Thiothrix sp.]MDD5391689.1 hypothetical protein [Thiothrix sp.]
MEILLVLLFMVVLIAVGSIPCLLFWWLAWKLLPKAYALPPYRMVVLCVTLSILTAMVLNLELEVGVLSIAPLTLVFTLLWSLLLLPIGIFAKYFYVNYTGRRS